VACRLSAATPSTTSTAPCFHRTTIDLKEVASIDQGNVFTLGKLLPEFVEVGFTRVKTFPIPVVMFMGRHDYTTPSEPTAAWLQAVHAPSGLSRPNRLFLIRYYWLFYDLLYPI
jgi:hypothetical protein